MARLALIRLFASTAAMTTVTLALDDAGPCRAHQDLPAIIASVTQEISRSPGDATLYLSRAELHRLHRHWAAAARDYTRAAELNPALVDVELGLARLAFDRGDLTLARRHLAQFLGRVPNHLGGLELLTSILISVGRRHDAVAVMDKRIEFADRPDVDLILRRSQILASLGPRYDQAALGGLLAAAERFGTIIVVELAAVELLVELERYDEALARLEHVSRYFDRQETLFAQQGDILVKAGRIDLAKERYRQTLVAIDGLSINHRRKKMVVELEAHVRRALESLP